MLDARRAAASPDVDAGTDASPRPEAYRVFVTGPPGFDGDLGGVAGADAFCAERARAVGLEGRFLAWISDGDLSPAGRLRRSDIPYRRLDGMIVADDWEDLTDGSLDAPIAVTETGELRERGNVWTGTRIDGAAKNPGTLQHCMKWSRALDAYFGGTGNYLYTDERWTDGTIMNCRHNIFGLYCFEQ